jgi:hypothetical protein
MTEFGTYKGFTIALQSDGGFAAEIYGVTYHREKLTEIKALIDDLIKTRRN